jgi:hypothetical protein
LNSAEQSYGVIFILAPNAPVPEWIKRTSEDLQTKGYYTIGEISGNGTREIRIIAAKANFKNDGTVQIKIANRGFHDAYFAPNDVLEIRGLENKPGQKNPSLNPLSDSVNT